MEKSKIPEYHFVYKHSLQMMNNLKDKGHYATDEGFGFKGSTYMKKNQKEFAFN